MGIRKCPYERRLDSTGNHVSSTSFGYPDGAVLRALSILAQPSWLRRLYNLRCKIGRKKCFWAHSQCHNTCTADVRLCRCSRNRVALCYLFLINPFYTYWSLLWQVLWVSLKGERGSIWKSIITCAYDKGIQQANCSVYRVAWLTDMISCKHYDTYLLT